jgi:hypothetical protein
MIARPLARRLDLKLGSYLLMRTKPRPSQLVLSPQRALEIRPWRLRYAPGGAS